MGLGGWGEEVRGQEARVRVGEGHDAWVRKGEQGHEAEGVRQGDEAVGPHLVRVRVRVVKVRVVKVRVIKVKGYYLG